MHGAWVVWALGDGQQVKGWAGSGIVAGDRMVSGGCDHLLREVSDLVGCVLQIER